MIANLPAHLQGRQVKSLTERASEGMGGSLPPHISIQGNAFTFIDAAGNEMQPMLTFDAVIVDIADRMNKRYYDKPYDQTATVYDPPRCWSANGITPTREVASPIHPQCEGCPANVRGSAVSKMSGASIKACRDEKWIAFIVPQLPQVIFQLVITPGSFQNWKAYTETLRGNRIEISLAITRFSFEPKTNGVLLFEMVNWIDEPTLQVVEAANREGKTDALVGRSDPIRQPALAAPVAAPAIAAPVQQEVISPNQAGTTGVAPGFGQAATTGIQTPFGASASAALFAHLSPAAAVPDTTTSAVASPSDAAPRRRRRSANEAAPAAAQVAPAFGQPATAAPQAPFGQPAQAAPAAAAPAPFGQPAPAGQFGIGGAAPVNAEMADMLSKMGFKQTNAA